MDIEIDVHPTEAASEGFAVVNLMAGGGRLCQLDLQYSRLAVLQSPSPLAVDFLLLASAIYAIDKLVPRSTADDHWTREVTLTVPVSDVTRWKSVKRELSSCISFLTGDLWKFKFTDQVTDPVRPVRRLRRRRRRKVTSLPPTGDAVSLFSGGLDSLIGVIDWLEENTDKRLLLVGHHDGQMAGPYSDQKGVLERLRTFYPLRTRSLFARVGHSSEPGETDITLRGRSLVFIALGVFAAQSLGATVPLLIPENGTIALNAPLTPSRRGSCSTRTAHPFFIATLNRILANVGLPTPLSNPLLEKTKGEAVTECLNNAALSDTAQLSVSCAKRGHKIHFTNRTAKSCGRCMPCIYRRAAMHAAGWDDELYGDDICAGDVDLDAEGEKPNDLRACFSFLNRDPSKEDIASMLMANGRLEEHRLSDFASMVQRTMDEIRQLLRDKAIPDIQRRASV